MTMTDTLNQREVEGSDDYGFALVGRLLAWLSEHYREQPSLRGDCPGSRDEPYHVQRLFTRYVGVSPKKYVQYPDPRPCQAGAG